MMDRQSKRPLNSCSLLVLIFALLNSQIAAKPKRRKSALQYSDCGNQDKIIHFHSLHATPVPVVIPGTLYVSIAGNVTVDLPRRINVYVTIKKYFLSFPFRVPCFNDGFGSCAYENICATLEQFETSGCPGGLHYQDIPCTCPFLAGEFNIRDVAFNIPTIQGFASSLIKGSYELELQIQEEDGPELGCLRVNFSTRKRRKKHF